NFFFFFSHFDSAIAMCHSSISVVTGCQKRSQRSRRQRNLGNPRSLQQTSSTVTSFSVGLWNCQSAVKKADFISGYANHLSLGLLAFTETWIKPENNATPAHVSTHSDLSHTRQTTCRGGGTGLLISDNRKFPPLLPSNRYASFEYHAIMVTAPV